MTELEHQGRMAQLLVRVTDPLDLKRPADQRRPLVLGSYVRVKIEGAPLGDTVQVPRGAVRDGKQVWIMAEDNTLELRSIVVRWSGEEDVFVSEGLNNGDKLILSDIATPVQGMDLRTADMEPTTPSKRPPDGTKRGPSEAKKRAEG